LVAAMRRRKAQRLEPMHELLESSIEAHGGSGRWRRIRRISATFAPGGIAFSQRGHDAFTRRATRVTVDTNEQWTTFTPFLAPGPPPLSQPYRTIVETIDGTILEALDNPRDSFGRMAPGTPWKATQLAYFAGYAMWMYLTVPFSLASND